MPYFCIDTNQPIEPMEIQTVMKNASGFIAGLLGKPESFVMVSITPAKPLIFGGTPEPAAFVRLKSIGLATDRCAEFSQKICDFVQSELGVPGDRVFIDFTDLQRQQFGWNHKTF